jgi:hypothetical protein
LAEIMTTLPLPHAESPLNSSTLSAPSPAPAAEYNGSEDTLNLAGEANMDLHEAVVVHTVTNPVEANLIKNLLQTEGIRCALPGLEQGFSADFSPFEIRIMVEAASADRARRLISSHQERSRQQKPSE